MGKLSTCCLALFLPGAILISCNGKEEPAGTQRSDIILQVSNKNVTAVNGKVEIDIKIESFEILEYLSAVKVTEYGELPMRLAKSKIGKEFTYTYLIKPTDPAEITYLFTGYDKSGNASETVSVRITNPKNQNNQKLSFSRLQCISRVTGKDDNGHNGLPAVKFTLNNRTDLKYNVGGTDLGIVWEIEKGKYGLFFGDTFGRDFVPNFAAPGPNGGWWRSNVLLFSSDTDLDDGMLIDGAAMDGNEAKQICFSAHNTSGNGDYTSIPTAAVHANGAEYVHYMNIKNWNGWVTNYSSLYKSKDKGLTWERLAGVNFAGESNFGQAGYFNDNGTVYMIGTKTGRTDIPYLAKFDEMDIENVENYSFWNGSGWVKGKESAAEPLFNDKAGELSFTYMPKLEKWVLLYFSDPRYEISMRYADNPEGPWSNPVQVANGRQWAQLYGSFIHPLSMEGTRLYFVMSMWLPYNTYLMSIDLKQK